jgi:hypothetical protein
MKSSRILLPLGLILMLLGWTLPLLMVLKIIPSTFFLNFFSWGASVAGLFIGMIGLAMSARLRK